MAGMQEIDPSDLDDILQMSSSTRDSISALPDGFRELGSILIQPVPSGTGSRTETQEELAASLESIIGSDASGLAILSHQQIPPSQPPMVSGSSSESSSTQTSANNSANSTAAPTPPFNIAHAFSDGYGYDDTDVEFVDHVDHGAFGMMQDLEVLLDSELVEVER